MIVPHDAIHGELNNNTVDMSSRETACFSLDERKRLDRRSYQIFLCNLKHSSSQAKEMGLPTLFPFVGGHI